MLSREAAKIILILQATKPMISHTQGKHTKHYTTELVINIKGPSWSWSYGSWICNYPCNQCLSPLTLWVQISLRRGVRDTKCTTLCEKVCQWLAAGRWFSLGTPVSSINKTDRHDIAEILLKVALNTITLTPPINIEVLELS